MRTIRQSWKQSLAALTLLASVGSEGLTASTPEPAAPAPAVQPAPPAPAVAPAPQNAPQMDPKLMERYGIRPTPPPAGPSRGVSGGGGGGGGFGGGFGGGGGYLGHAPGSVLEGRLEQIVFDEVAFDGIPLPEVLKFLNEESPKRDAEKKGINFLINPNVAATASAAPLVDPTTGNLIPAPSPEPLDMNNVLVRFNLPLRDVRLKDVLDAVVKVADKPILYSVEDYAVVFSQNPEAMVSSTGVALPPNAATPLTVRTFKVDTNNFAAGLERAFGIKLEVGAQPSDVGRSKQMQSALRQLLTQLGISMDVSGKAVFYNDLTAVIMVRATADDLEIVKAAIETLGGTVHDSEGQYPGSQMSDVMRQRYGLPATRR